MSQPARPFRALRRAIASEKRLASMVSSIVSSQLVTGFFGFLFWGIASRAFPHVSVGSAGAAVAAIMLVSQLALLGQGSLIVSELPQTPDGQRRRLLQSGRRLALTAGAFVGLVVFAVTAGQGAFRDFAPDRWGYLVAAVGCALVAEAGVHDTSMLVVDRPRSQVARNAVSSVVRILLLGVVALALDPGSSRWGSSTVLLLCWLGGWVPGNLLARAAVRRATSPGGPEPVFAQLRGHLKRHGLTAAQHHGISVALASGFLLQPVVIGAVISRADNARFTAVRLLAGFVLLVPYAIASGLFTASADGEGDLLRRSRRATRLALTVSVAMFAVTVVVAEPLVVALGGRFAADGANALRIMCAAGPALVYKDQYIAVARTLRRLDQALVVVATGAVCEIVGIAVGVNLGGLDGALAGWLSVLAVEAVVSERLLKRAFASAGYFDRATSAP